jgi:hypothetical protein
MKKKPKNEKMQRVRSFLGALLKELDTAKTVMPPEEFNILVESVVYTIKQVASTTKDKRPVV